MICCSSSDWTFHYARQRALSQNSFQSVSKAVMKLCLSKSPFRSLSLSFNTLMNIWFVFVRLAACGFAFEIVCDSERRPRVLLSNLWRHNYFCSLLFACMCVCVSALSFLRVFLTRNANVFVPLLAFSGLERAFSSFISLWHNNSETP